MKSIAVFCGSSSGIEPVFAQNAKELGDYLTNNQIKLIYGGGKVGLMGVLAESVLKNDGLAIGVIPKFLKEKEIAHTGLTELIITQNMHERKLKMHELSDGIVMLPGGFGTLEEFFEMVTWAQLGLHQKPIGILNTNGFYDDLLELFEKMILKGFLKEDNCQMIQVATHVEELLEKMLRYEPVMVPKWINKEQV